MRYVGLRDQCSKTYIHGDNRLSAKKHLNKVASRSQRMLNALTTQINEQREELEATEYYKRYSKAMVGRLPKLSRAIVDKTVSEMEAAGYEFTRRKTGSSSVYDMDLEDISAIYQYRRVPRYRDRHSEAFVITISNLKGGVSKTVSTVTLAHGLRAHPSLFSEDLRILVIDLDPQASATMFLSHNHSIGSVENTAAQAMLQDVPREELIDDFIISSGLQGVDLIPASIEDAFLASDWEELCEEHLPDQNRHAILRENLIDKLSKDYDFIFIDSGPHLDSFLTNSLASAHLIMTPIPPAQVDFHSTLKYLSRLPEVIDIIEETGCELRLVTSIGFMSKLANKVDHKLCHSFAKEVFGGDMLDQVLPRLDAFERCGESFDTVISARPSSYAGSANALRSARSAAMEFVKAFYDRVEFIRMEMDDD